VQIIHAQGVSVQQVRAAAIWSSHLSFWRYLRKHAADHQWQRLLNLVYGPLLIIAACVRLIAHSTKLIKRGFHAMVT
jgi:hypothetical protein